MTTLAPAAFASSTATSTPASARKSLGVRKTSAVPEDDFRDPRAGGHGSVIMRGSESFSLPLRGSSPSQRRAFVVGNAFFKENWVPAPSSVKSRQGLGPLLNAQSCSSCHFKDGRGLPPENAAEIPLGLLVRISVPGQSDVGGPKPHPVYGEQIQHRANLGVEPEADVSVDYEKVNGSYADGTAFELRRPVVRLSHFRYGEPGPDLLISARLAPQVTGLGLLEAVPEAQVLAHADPEDRNGDGIRGRPNYVWDVVKKKKALGRYGWKANQPTLEQQNAAAFSGDMGITSHLFPAVNCPTPGAAVSGAAVSGAAVSGAASGAASGAPNGNCLKSVINSQPELAPRDLDDVTTYTQLLAVPYRRNLDDAQAQRGREIFRAASCQSCHVSAFITGDVAGRPELSRQTIYPYTDLLLHNMGEGLADGRPDFAAGGQDWRTSPLWGAGLIAEVNGRARFLHDGRARDIPEAILWHGGEAEAAKEKFRTMDAKDRAALVKFVESL